jgi:hypothetical protein
VLPVEGGVPFETLQELNAKGWEVVDVRLLDGGEAIRHTLEGIRLGTIPAARGDIKYLELEAKIYGLGKGEVEKEPEDKKLQDQDVDFLLSSFGGRVDSDAPEEGLVSGSDEPGPKKQSGRPKGKKDSAPRKPHGELRGAALLAKQKKEAELAQRNAPPTGSAVVLNELSSGAFEAQATTQLPEAENKEAS